MIDNLRTIGVLVGSFDMTAIFPFILHLYLIGKLFKTSSFAKKVLITGIITYSITLVLFANNLSAALLGGTIGIAFYIVICSLSSVFGNEEVFE